LSVLVGWAVCGNRSEFGAAVTTIAQLDGKHIQSVQLYCDVKGLVLLDGVNEFTSEHAMPVTVIIFTAIVPSREFEPILCYENVFERCPSSTCIREKRAK
jgi:hypothetical protein